MDVGRRLVTVVVAMLIVAGSARAGQPEGAELLDSVLAFVDGQIIMRSDVRAFSELGLVAPPATVAADERVLTALIERQLVLAEVARYVVDDPPAAEVPARFGEVVERVGGTSFFESLLPLVGLERSDVFQIARDDLRIELYLAGRFPSSDMRSDLVSEWIAALIARADVLRGDP